MAGGFKAWGKEYSKKSFDSSPQSPVLDTIAAQSVAIAAQSVNRLAAVLAETVEEVGRRASLG